MCRAVNRRAAYALSAASTPPNPVASSTIAGISTQNAGARPKIASAADGGQRPARAEVGEQTVQDAGVAAAGVRVVAARRGQERVDGRLHGGGVPSRQDG